MARRPHPKWATRNPHDGPWSSCDRCGFVVSQNRMTFQYDFLGGSVPQSLGLLVCPTCLDDLNFQQKLLILPPDPRPIYNTRPEPYVVDETNWLTTQDGDIIDTVSGDDYITSIPNPSENPNTANLVAALVYPSGSASVLYLDLFDGNPASGGLSVLAAITGSATRTDIAAQMTTNAGLAQNTNVISVTSSVVALTANLSYIAFYNAPTGGTRLVSGPVSVTFPTITQGAAVAFPAQALTINLT